MAHCRSAMHLDQGGSMIMAMGAAPSTADISGRGSMGYIFGFCEILSTILL